MEDNNVSRARGQTPVSSGAGPGPVAQSAQALDDGEEISLVDLAATLWRRKRLIVGVTLVAAVFSVAYALLQPNRYTATSSLLPISGSASSSLAQYAGLSALEESGLAQDIVAAFAARRDMMLAALDTLPQITFFPPQGAFYVLVDISALIGKHYQGKVISDDTVFAEMLLEEAGVSVVPGGAFYAPGTCRLSYAISEERMSEAIRRIGVFISQIS